MISSCLDAKLNIFFISVSPSSKSKYPSPELNGLSALKVPIDNVAKVSGLTFPFLTILLPF